MERIREARKVAARGLGALLEESAARFASRPALVARHGDGYDELAYTDLVAAVRELASVLIERGVRPGDRVAILSESRPEWGVAFFAVLRAGAVVVPLDPRMTERELLGIVADSGAALLFFSEHHEATASTFRERVPALREVLRLDGALDLRAERIRDSREGGPDATAVVTYTSGTTGAPKGVQTTVGNLLFQTRQLGLHVRLADGEVFLSVLGLNHLLELVGGFLAPLVHGAEVCYSHSLLPNELLAVMRERRVTRMVAVPMLLEILASGVEKELAKRSSGERAAFRLALALADGMPRALRRRVFRSVHRRFGEALACFVVGGAPLDRRVERFWTRLGMRVLQGYGMTETSPVIAVNTPANTRLGSVGRPLPGVEVKLVPRADEPGLEPHGEIVTRGPHLMKGYLGRDDLTKEIVDSDGWLHTGDLGWMDDDGFLYVTGRIKNLIALGSGKKVQPEEVEAHLGSSPLFQESCVLGAARNGRGEQVCAVVVPREGVALDEDGAAREIKRLCADLAPYKRPSRVVVRAEPLPRTATRKVRRRELHGWMQNGGGAR